MVVVGVSWLLNVPATCRVVGWLYTSVSQGRRGPGGCCCWLVA